DEFLGTGETNVEFFGSARRNFDHMSLVGHIGVRINQDADLGPLQLEGDNSFLAGAAFQFPAGERLLFTVEWAVETNRFEGRNNSSQLLGGFQYEVVDSVLVRGALAGALSSDTPDADFIGSVVWLF
ncbi:MAG: hypothetical protein ACE5HU_01455, partial [Acidobacteriota bacterium]